MTKRKQVIYLVLIAAGFFFGMVLLNVSIKVAVAIIILSVSTISLITYLAYIIITYWDPTKNY